MDSGDHPPGVEYRVACTANDGKVVTLSNDAVTVSYVFTEGGAEYFVVGDSYAVLASSPGE